MSDNTNDRTTRPERGGGAPVVELVSGTQVRDYVVREVIGSGGFGTVYQVEHVVLGRKAALKALHADLVTSDEALRRFEREARVVNMIDHPNVVDIYDFGYLDDRRPFYVMELLCGIDLEARIQAQGRLQPDEVLAVLVPLCDALAAAHEKEVVHRDVKASNVFLDDQTGETRVVLLDFGIAKLLEPGTIDLTTSRHAVGTPTCMAPEQITGSPVDARADVYALGALVYHMLAGTPPFAEHTATMMQYMHMHARRPAPSTRVPNAVALDAVVARAMAIRPDERFTGARDFLAAFRQAVETAGTPRAAGPVCRAVAIYVELRLDPRETAEPTEPDDALLADLEAVLPDALRRLGDAGFTVSLEVGNAALAARVLEGDDPEADRAARADAIRAAQALHAALLARPGRDPRVHVNVAVHAGAVLVAGGRIKGGELARTSGWAPDEDVGAVVATAAAAEGTGVTLRPLGKKSLYECPRTSST